MEGNTDLRPSAEARIAPGRELERQVIMLLRIGDPEPVRDHIQKRNGGEGNPDISVVRPT